MTETGTDLPAYVDAIEGYLGRLRGRPVSLVGHEFALARGFHAAGVSLASVLSAIDQGCEAAGPVVSLSFCSRFLRRSMRSASCAAPGEAAPPSPLPESATETLGRLEALVGALSREPWREDLTARRLLQQARALLQSSPADIRDQILRIDRGVDAWIASGLSGEELERCRRELRRSLARAASSPAARDEAVRREAVRRARERLGLARLA